jgi:predicted NUDIX family phosphoesterase
MEFVWVVPRQALFPRSAVHGFCKMDLSAFEQDFLSAARDRGFFMERRYAEVHPEFKQPIPYVAVTCEDQVFTMTRLSGGEKRLQGKRGIGVGGHINPIDAPTTEAAPDLFAAACQRELAEELILPAGPLPLEPLGLLNDDSTEVGAVHVGVVYRLPLNPDQASQISIRETDGIAGQFEDYSDLLDAALAAEPRFETWSSLLLRSGVLAPRSAATVG